MNILKKYIDNEKMKNSLLYKINSRIKAVKTKLLYQKIVNYYDGKNTINNKNIINNKIKKIQNSNIVKKLNSGNANIFYLGTDESQDKSGFLGALNKYGQVNYFTKSNGQYGQYKRGEQCYKEKNADRTIELLSEIYLENKTKLDIFLMQTWAWRVDNKLFDFIRVKFPEAIIVNICMDDRHAYTDHGNWSNGTYGLIDYLDFSLVSSPECVDWYHKEGTPSFYFPEASDENIFTPIDIEKKYQVGFVGACYGIRRTIVETLIKNGIEVKAYGSGWPDGRLELEKTNLFYNQCEIVLGVGTIGHCHDFYALKLRDFDVPMSGSIYVTHNNSDLKELFIEGEEIFLASNITDFVNVVTELLDMTSIERGKIRNKTRIKALEKHTYRKRFDDLISELENLELLK